MAATCTDSRSLDLVDSARCTRQRSSCGVVDKIPQGYWVQYKDGNRRNFAISNLYLKSNSEFRKEEYKEGRLGFQLTKSELDEWIFGSCLERRTW